MHYLGWAAVIIAIIIGSWETGWYMGLSFGPHMQADRLVEKSFSIPVQNSVPQIAQERPTAENTVPAQTTQNQYSSNFSTQVAQNVSSQTKQNLTFGYSSQTHVVPNVPSQTTQNPLSVNSPQTHVVQNVPAQMNQNPFAPYLQTHPTQKTGALSFEFSNKTRQ
ncbi:MAG: hypothetical protein KGI25_05445 [Thaumarchaeota archaeon]|nr:hypothetical protein [Nitrososphaerota archaeon]